MPLIATTHANTAAVVLYLQEFETSFFHCNANGRGARVEAVFEKLFERRRRSVNDLVIVNEHTIQLGGYYATTALTSPAAMRFMSDCWSFRMGKGSLDSSRSIASTMSLT
jgi:hypothetical protein